MNTNLANLIKSRMAIRTQWETDHLEWARKRNELELLMKTELLPCLVPATPEDYKQWLKGFMACGGTPKNYHDYNMPNSFYKACKDFAVLPLLGTSSLSIIIPRDISIKNENEDIGHCNLFFMDGYRHKGIQICVYRNTLV